MFLPTDTEQAEREQDCYGYCLKNAINHYMQGDFKKAAIYLDNASRSLNELDKLKNQHDMYHEAKKLLMQIEDRENKREKVRRNWF